MNKCRLTFLTGTASLMRGRLLTNIRCRMTDRWRGFDNQSGTDASESCGNEGTEDDTIHMTGGIRLRDLRHVFMRLTGDGLSKCVSSHSVFCAILPECDAVRMHGVNLMSKRMLYFAARSRPSQAGRLSVHSEEIAV